MTHCTFCAAEPAVWAYEVDADLEVTSPLAGGDFTSEVGRCRWLACGSCRRLVVSGRRHELADLLAHHVLADLALAGDLAGDGQAERTHREMVEHAHALVGALWVYRCSPHPTPITTEVAR
jgi:hypothetical protein